MDIPKIINAIESQPFLADRRMVIIKGIPYATVDKQKLELDNLEETLKNLPESSLVVFVSPNPDKRLGFYKFLLKNASTENFPLLSGTVLSAWAENKLEIAGKRISHRALDLLLLYCAEDNSRLAGELDKLCLLDKKDLDEADIDKFVSPSPEAKIFKSLDLIGKADPGQLLQSFQNLVRSGESLMLVFYMIVRQFRLLLQTKYLLDRKANQFTIQKRLKMAPFQVSMLMKQADVFSFESLEKVYQQLINIDLQIKTGKIPTSSSNEELLHLRIDQILSSLSSF